MSGPFGSSQWLYEAGGDFYPTLIDNSLRFDSAYMYRIPSTTGNRRTWTASTWVKRSKLGVQQALFGALNYDASSVNQQTRLSFDADDTLVNRVYDKGDIYVAYSTAVFRDTSAWYHIVWVFDSTNATASLRSRVYVNGVEIATSASYPPLNYDSYFNHAGTQFNVGSLSDYTLPYSDMPAIYYSSEINFVDGQALDPSYFGEYDNTGTIWIPKAYSGSYGTNGFHLDFADDTSATTLGYDAAGSNNFTPSGIATSDQMLDSPTNNFCTINPLKIGSVTLSEGNLQHQHSTASTWRGVTPTMHVSSGKWYWEVAFTNVYTPPASTTQALVGIVSENETQTDVTAATYFTGRTAEAYGYYNYGGSIWNNNSGTAYGSTWGNATIGIALDLDSSPKTLEFFLNGVSQGVLQDGTNINLGDKAWGPGASTYYSSIASYNFGQFDFTYTPPSDFLALSSVNLPTPTFDPAQGASPLDAFNSVLYDGDGIDAHAITGAGFSPDFTWIKARGPNTRNHRLTDTVRGATRSLATNTDNAEIVDSTHLQSFDADGFTLGTQASFNASGESYVAWNWKLGGSSNTFNIDGTGYATASAAGLDGGTQNPTGASVNTKSGIGIYTYTGDGTNKTIAHGLGVSPNVVILKNRNNVANWFLYTNAVDGTMNFGYINLTNAFLVSGRSLTSTTFDHDGSVDQGANGNNYVAWVFAEKEGFSKFGSYVGNGSANGPFVYLGFRPAFILIKNTTSAHNWMIEDVSRSPSNVADDVLHPNLSNIEDSQAAHSIDFLSNGFKIRNSAIGWINNTGDTFLYMAFAEQPFKYSNAR